MFLMLEGFCIGLTFQTTLVAVQANAPAKDRAVVTGARNFCRTLGGAFGLAACGTIYNNVVRKNLRGADMLPAVQEQLDKSILSVPVGATPAEEDFIVAAYGDAIDKIFIMFIPVGGLCVICSLFVKDKSIEKEVVKDVEKDSASLCERAQDALEEDHDEQLAR